MTAGQSLPDDVDDAVRTAARAVAAAAPPVTPAVRARLAALLGNQPRPPGSANGTELPE